MSKLAIDTSSSANAYISLETGGVFCDFESTSTNHSENLLSYIKDVLKSDKETLEAVYIAKGPGSFTGLRIGASCAKGISSALDIPVFALSTLASYAYSYTDSNKVDSGEIIIPLLDAKKQRFYSAIFKYENNSLVQIMPDSDISLDNLVDTIANNKLKDVVFVCSSGVDVKNLDVNFTYKSINISACQNPARSLLKHAKDQFGISEGPAYIRPVDAKAVL